MRSQLTRDGWAVVGVHALFIAGVGLSTTFVNVYLWRNGGGLGVVVHYHMALFLAFGLGAVLGGLLSVKMDRIVALRAGVAMHALFFTGVLLLGARAPAFVWPLGALMGLGMGFYYLGCSVLMYDFSDSKASHHLVAAVDQARLAGMTVMPFLAGWAIDRMPSGHGYRFVFAASVLFFLVAVAFSRKMPPARTKGKIDMHNLLLADRQPKWRQYLVAQGWRGLRDGVFLFLAGILVFERVKSEWALAIFTFGTGALTWIATSWVGARSTPDRYRLFLTLGVIGSVAAALALALIGGVTGAIVFGGLEALSLPLVAVPFSSVSYTIAADDAEGRHRGIGYMVARELPLNLGRLIGVAVLLAAITWIRHPSAVPVMVGVLGLANLLALWALRRGVV